MLTDTSISESFRRAKLHVTTGGAMNLRGTDVTAEENTKFVHKVMGPMLYKYGEGSYYSESEHCMSPGQWQQRLWGQEVYDRLLRIKQTWDPENIFACRHCVGDEAQPSGAHRYILNGASSVPFFSSIFVASYRSAP